MICGQRSSAAPITEHALQAISIIGETLEKFDDDKLIPAYGFGCARTHDRGVFSFLPQDQPCNGFAHVQQRYRQLAPVTTLSGPTSFAPLIRHAMNIVKQSGGQYHILLIVADGQVTRPSDLPKHHLSEQEQETINAIVEACALPLSIVMVGVGDGPWDVMEQFDDNLPERAWDNFQVRVLALLRHAPAFCLAHLTTTSSPGLVLVFSCRSSSPSRAPSLRQLEALLTAPHRL